MHFLNLLLIMKKQTTPDKNRKKNLDGWVFITSIQIIKTTP